MYRMKQRVKYSEVNKKEEITISKIVNYLQDCTIFHSEDLGRGMEYLKERNRAWLLSAWQIQVERYPVLGEEIYVETWPYDFKGFYGYRNFDLVDTKGNQLVRANSVWFFVDTQTGRPVKPTLEEISPYILEQPIPMEYANRKISIPKEGEEKEKIVVLKSHIDTNHHVNNAKYVEMGEEYLPEDFVVKQMRADYRKETKLKEQLIPIVTKMQDGYIVRLCGEDLKPHVIIEYIGA